MAHIDYYFSTISSYTHLACGDFEKIASAHNASVTYRPLDIVQLFARTGGTPPAQRHPSRQEYRAMDLSRTARMLGREINPQPLYWPTNPAPSGYAIIAAQRAGGGDLPALVAGFCRACWVENRDIAADEVVRTCLEVAGFDPGLADRDMLESAEAFARNLEDAVAAGVFGAPFWITDDGQRFWGRDRLSHLDWYLGQ